MRVKYDRLNCGMRQSCFITLPGYCIPELRHILRSLLAAKFIIDTGSLWSAEVVIFESTPHELLQVDSLIRHSMECRYLIISQHRDSCVGDDCVLMPIDLYW